MKTESLDSVRCDTEETLDAYLNERSAGVVLIGRSPERWRRCVGLPMDVCEWFRCFCTVLVVTAS